MKQSESIKELASALARVHLHVSPVAKDRTNSHFKNKYATLDAIMESVRPLLAGEGLSIVQGGGSPVSNANGDIVGIAVETMLVHASGEFITSAIVLPLEKLSPQGAGSAITYGRRYGVTAVLALTTDDDDDGNQASTPRPQQASAPAPAASNGAAKPQHMSAAAAKKMPFGKQKGTELGKIDTASLDSTINWCSADAEKKEKFKDLIAACEDVLRERLDMETVPPDDDQPPF